MKIEIDEFEGGIEIHLSPSYLEISVSKLNSLDIDTGQMGILSLTNGIFVLILLISISPTRYLLNSLLLTGSEYVTLMVLFIFGYYYFAYEISLKLTILQTVRNCSLQIDIEQSLIVNEFGEEQSFSPDFIEMRCISELRKDSLKIDYKLVIVAYANHAGPHSVKSYLVWYQGKLNKDTNFPQAILDVADVISEFLEISYTIKDSNGRIKQ